MDPCLVNRNKVIAYFALWLSVSPVLAGLRRTRRGRATHALWHACGEGKRARGEARNPLQKSSSPLSPGKRCGATAQSALGWYRPSAGVSETLDGKPSGVLSVQFNKIQVLKKT